MIDQPTIDRILDAAQIVDVISEFVSLKKKGVNYVGLCPFHDDKTPSFYVSPSKGLCKCFACGKGGNVAHFIMKHEQVNYYDALRWLAKKYHIEVKERELTNEEKEAQGIRESLFVVNEFARDYFQDTLYNHTDGKSIGMSYFRQRGIRDDIVRKFHLGYSISERDALAKEALRKGYKKDFLIKTGLCYEIENGSIRDRFGGRVIFPWLNISGKTVGFGGRVLDNRTKGIEQKYVNSPESDIYSKRKELYGIYQAKSAIVKKDNVYMVEGYTDVIAMHQCGIENVVANSGTVLSKEQVRLLHRFTSNITLMYDSDEAGIKASIRGIDMLLSEGMNVKVLLLPDGEDPDSFVRKHTLSEIQKYINDNEENFIRFKCSLLLKDTINDPFKKASLISDMAGSIGLIPNEIVRYSCLKECASILGVDEKVIMNEITQTLKNCKDESPKPKTESAEMAESLPMSDFLLNQKEILLVQALIRYGEQIICYKEDENGQQTPVNVADYILIDLEQDGLSFQNPIHKAMLLSAVERFRNNNIRADRFFLSCTDPRISELAADLLNESYSLSKSNELGISKNEERLHLLIPHLLVDYKRSVVDIKMKETAELLRCPDIVSSTDKVFEVMQRYKALTEASKRLASKSFD